jgi:general stress protein 26
MATAATSDDKKPARRAAAKTTGAKPAGAKSSSAKSAVAKSDGNKSATTKAASTKAPSAKADKSAHRAAQPANRQSRDSSMTGKEHDEHVARVWELAKRIGIAMFVTWDGEEQRARPLAATVEKDEGCIYFLTDVNGQKDEQIAEFPHVSVSFADHRHSKYVALSGKATVSNDRNKIKDLWTPFAKAWWDGPDDPAIRVIKLVPRDAELWDSPGSIVTTISMLAAAVTGRSPKVGENAKVIL